MKKNDIWFVRKFIGFIPAHINGVLLLAFTVASVLGLPSLGTWLSKHHFSSYFVYGCNALAVASVVIFFILFLAHADWK